MPPANGYTFDNQSGNTTTPGKFSVAAGDQNAYAYSPNGNGGLNYYAGTSPITNTQYAQATGQDTGALESQAQANFNNGQVLDDSTQAATAAANDQAVNSGLNRLGAQQGVGDQNILNSYNSAFQQLTGQKAADLQNLTNQQSQAQSDNQSARDNIGASVRNVSQGLARLLGIHGAGNSSAATVLAPFAAAQQGNQQRSQVQQAYGQNMNALDQAITGTNTGYDNSFGQLATDKQQKENDLQSSIAQQRANLLGQRSDATNNQPAIQAILDSITQLGLNPTFTPKAVQVAAPNLSQYNYTPTTAPTLGGDSGVSGAALQAAGPYYSLLAGQQKKTLAGA